VVLRLFLLSTCAAKALQARRLALDPEVIEQIHQPVLAMQCGRQRARTALVAPQCARVCASGHERHPHTRQRHGPELGTRAALPVPNSVRRGMSDQFGCDDVLERARAARPSGVHNRIASEEAQHEVHFTQSMRPGRSGAKLKHAETEIEVKHAERVETVP
jgi:hypothetical protein